MNNEPVAWMRTNKQWRKEISWVEKEGFDIPLYTHPAKDNYRETHEGFSTVIDAAHPVKTLTVSKDDVANLVCSGKYWTLDDHLNIVSVHFDKFVEAILRKAQEK